MSAYNWFDFVRITLPATRTAAPYDPTGGNRDRLSIVRGTTETLLDVQGPGCITHIWNHRAQPRALSTCVNAWLKMYWDGEEAHPACSCRLGISSA